MTEWKVIYSFVIPAESILFIYLSIYVQNMCPHYRFLQQSHPQSSYSTVPKSIVRYVFFRVSRQTKKNCTELRALFLVILLSVTEYCKWLYLSFSSFTQYSFIQKYDSDIFQHFNPFESLFQPSGKEEEFRFLSR